MRNFKSERKITVYAAPTQDNDTPLIRLQGKWLREVGFDIGDPVIVEVRGGELRITPANEILVDDK